MPRRWALYRSAEPRRGFAVASSLIASFIVLGLITRFLCKDAAGNSSFWPANAAIVVAVLVLPRRLSLLVAGVCFGLNILLNSLTSYMPADSVLFSSLNIGVAFLTAFLTRSLCGAAVDLTRFSRLATFVVIAFFAAGVEAGLGEMFSTTAPAGHNVVDDWLQWALCDGLGLVLATPAILLFVKHLGAHDDAEAGRVERYLLLILTVALTALSFLLPRAPLFLLIYPALVAIAFRAGPPWVLASVLLVSIMASALTAHGFGPLALLSLHGRLLREDMLQPYLVSLFLVAVPANNALGEKARTARRLRRMRATVEHSANHDALTSLVNRSLFQRRLAACVKAGTGCAVFYVDIDRFKQVNDSLGHQAGDELLRSFGSRLTLSVSDPAILCARLGGDEFAVLLPGLRRESEVSSLCATIVEAARIPFALGRGPAHVSASIGVALADTGLTDAGELVRQADIALYAAKAAGRDGFRIFSEELDHAIRDRAELEADLRAALEGGAGLALHYQLKFDRHGLPTGVEALLRWRHPRLGFIPPSRFVPIAEETGLIVPLGAWAFGEAVAFAERAPHLTVAVNVSPVQLRQPEFAAEILRVLKASSAPAGQIEIEVTETALLDELAPTIGCLAELRAAGVSLALDDFGTGYSSLRHLHRFAVDRVKIDQSFVKSLADSAESAAIVQAVIQLGHAMGLQVTAEGVETEAQRAFLIAAGVDELQGYLLAKPVEEAALPAIATPSPCRPKRPPDRIFRPQARRRGAIDSRPPRTVNAPDGG